MNDEGQALQELALKDTALVKLQHDTADLLGALAADMRRAAKALETGDEAAAKAFVAAARAKGEQGDALLKMGDVLCGLGGAYGAQRVKRLSPWMIQQRMRVEYMRFTHCYEEGLGRNPNLAGRVALHFTIGKDGKVLNAESVSAPTSSVGVPMGNSPVRDLKDARVVACLLENVKKLVFPPFEEGTPVKVTYPIAFSPKED